MTSRAAAGRSASSRSVPRIGAPLRLAQLDPARLAGELVALQRRAYRVEADLIGDERIPPLHETEDELAACGETFLGAFLEGRLAGFVSWKLADGTLDLHRLAVDPVYARRGIGRALVRAAEEQARGARRAIVQTGAANAPARALYAGEGYAERGEVEALPGLRVARFEKRLAQTP